MAHDRTRRALTWLQRVAAGMMGVVILTACTFPNLGSPHTKVGGTADVRTLYLPSIFRSPLPVRLFLPRVVRQVVVREYFPSISKNFSRCAVYGNDCAEPNGTRALAVVLTELNRPYFGTVFTATADAYDYFVVTLVMNKRYTMTLAGGLGPGSTFAGQNDADLYLYGASAPPLASSAGYGSVAEAISFVAPASGQYFLLAYAFHTPASPASYRIEVRDRP